MKNWERDTLKNLYDFHKQIDWIEFDENIAEFFTKIPSVEIDERGLTIMVSGDNREIILGFGEYGGVGEMFDGKLFWQIYDNNPDESRFYEFGEEVANGSPFYVWHTIYSALSAHIEKGGAKWKN
jgi:hypothetical protein